MSKKTRSFRELFNNMEVLMGGAVRGEANEQAAQDLVYDSWECEHSEKALELLTKAVTLDPANIDAWLGIIDLHDLTDDERIDMLRQLKEMFERKRGKEFFEENEGYFWGLLETRPYMRACSLLAMELAEANELDESIAVQETMLKLNPNDNQGVRYGLMAAYLMVDKLDDLRNLFERHADELEDCALFAWGRVLERVISGEKEEAVQALIHAKELNSYAIAYLLGYRKLPKNMPDAYSMGSREEAIVVYNILAPAWGRHLEALLWLKSNSDAK